MMQENTQKMHPVNKHGLWARYGAQIRIILLTVIGLTLAKTLYFKGRYFLKNDLPFDFGSMFSFGDTSFGLISTFVVVLVYLLVVAWMRAMFGERHVKLRYALTFVLTAILGGAAAAFNMIIYISVLNDYDMPGIDALFDTAFLAFITPLTLMAVFETFHYRGAWLQEQYAREQARREMISATFEALKNQLNPHFVFNSFNTLGALIEEQPERAQLFLNQLSQVYRYILDNKDKETVSLGRELESVRALLYVQDARHPGAVQIDFDIGETDKSLRVIPLTLHTLVENVFKHNILSTTAPIHLKIFVSNGELLIVENDLKPKLEVESHHIGIDNLSRRYELLMQQGLTILKDADTFRVEVPFIRTEAI